MKKRLGPSTNTHKMMMCCGQIRKTIRCFHCGSDSLDGISDVSKNSGMETTGKLIKGSTDKILITGDVCLIQHSPFRILRVKMYFLLSLLSLTFFNNQVAWNVRASISQFTWYIHETIQLLGNKFSSWTVVVWKGWQKTDWLYFATCMSLWLPAND